MADIALAGALTFAGTNASKYLLEPMFHSDDIMRNYTIYPNVKFKQFITMAPSLKSITAQNSGCDTTNACDPAGFTMEQKAIEVKQVSVKQTQCWNEFQNLYIAESYKAGLSMPDLTGTQIAEVILDRVRKGIQYDTVRNMWAGDPLAAVADCSYQSMGDGLWQLLSVGTAINSATQMREVTGSLGAAAAEYVTVGATLPAADAVLVLEDVWNTAPAELQQTPASDKRLFCTPNIYNAWYSALTQVASAGSVDYGHSESQSGKQRLYFRGVELVPVYEWDTALTALTGADVPPLFTAAGAAIQCANGVIYAAKDNLIIGTNVADPDNQLKMFYDEASDNMYVRSNFTMGFQYGWDSLVNGSMLVD
tara:strand:- start:1127 stop:2221 length:1095 start_codon:yes stop_codon:yes gene_type:complete